MERLDTKKDFNPSANIKKLELAIVEGKITERRLDNLQTKLDEYDEVSDESDYKAYELQALIYYARNDKTKSLQFIEDALSLEEDLSKYSRTGALLAELYLDNSDKTNQNDTEEIADNQLAEEYDEQIELAKQKEITLLRKKYSGKFEGWLALYTLRIVLTPFVFLYDVITAINYDLNEFPDDIKIYFTFTLITETLTIIGGFALWYLYFKKKKSAKDYISIFEANIAILQVLFGFWLLRLFNEYDIADDPETGKFFIYGIIASLWVVYWRISKRVKATFIN